MIWLICVLCALALALGALLIALKANRDNSLVQFVLDAADTVDLGVFSKDEGIKQFKGRRGDQERPSTGARRDRVAGRRSHPRPDHPALIRCVTSAR